MWNMICSDFLCSHIRIMELKIIAVILFFITSVAAKSIISSDSELREKLVDLQHRHVDWLLDHPDVTAVDVNHKSVDGKETDQLSLVVWVRKKLPENEVPEERRLPREIEGYSVDVIEGEEAVHLQVSLLSIYCHVLTTTISGMDTQIHSL